MTVSGEVLALAARLCVAAAFAVSAAAKITRPTAFAGGLAAFGVPAPGAVARLLPPFEAALAVVLVAVPGAAWPAFLAVAVLALLTGAVVANLAAGRAVPCPCFDADSDRPVSTATVVRNGALLALAVVGTGSTAGADPGATVAVAAVPVAVTVFALRRFG